MYAIFDSVLIGHTLILDFKFKNIRITKEREGKVKMNKVGPNKPSESGITLIALLVMIILLVILAGVTIKGLVGNEGLLFVAETSAEEHKIAVYKERIEQNVRATVIGKGIMRKSSNTSET